MPGRRPHRLVRRRIALPPQNLPVLRIDSHCDLVIALSGKLENLPFRKQRRSIALPDSDLPLSIELLRPALRLSKCELPIPARAAPLSPILAPSRDEGRHKNQKSKALHKPSLNNTIESIYRAAFTRRWITAAAAGRCGERKPRRLLTETAVCPQ